MKTAQEYLPTSYWLMKTEPDVYSIDDLIADGEETWDGVRNYQARNFMRNEMKPGHRVLIYHSRIAEPGIVGEAEVVSEPIPDETAFDPGSKYHDPRSRRERPTWWMVTIGNARKFDRILTLSQLKTEVNLSEMLLLRRGQRLSIQPLSEGEYRKIMELAAAK